MSATSRALRRYADTAFNLYRRRIDYAGHAALTHAECDAPRIVYAAGLEAWAAELEYRQADIDAKAVTA